MRIIQHRRIYLSLSAAFVIAAAAAIAVFGFRLGIDFTGGSLVEISFSSPRPSVDSMRRVIEEAGFDPILQPIGTDRVLVRSKQSDEGVKATTLFALQRIGEAKVQRFSLIGPTISREIARKAAIAVALALLLIVLYIAFAFRKVVRPVSSWIYGLATLIALFHDVVISVGAYAVLGRFLGVEFNTAAIAAVLTILGFSVHDTIVVFDRTRENLLKGTAGTFEEVVNASVNQSVARSINTSLTVVFALMAVFLFGGATTKYFALVLILGIAFGTYSSIFVASPILVIWERWRKR
ncbi:protein translocase subunit SecF [Candidatus Parcubacteria bacterium]|nr:protein translocase subunit SecF [Candidatus Parcubacteria bacterium]